mgnify:CR=1 FL=1
MLVLSKLLILKCRIVSSSYFNIVYTLIPKLVVVLVENKNLYASAQVDLAVGILIDMGCYTYSGSIGIDTVEHILFSLLKIKLDVSVLFLPTSVMTTSL